MLFFIDRMYGLLYCTKKWQWVVLLAAGIVFYAGAGVSYLAVVGLTALVVYGCSLLMQKNLDQQEELLKDADRKAARKDQK